MAFEWLKKLFEKDDKKDTANKSGGTQSSSKSTASKTTGQSSSVSKSTSVLPTVTAKSSSTSTMANRQTGSTPSLLAGLQKNTPKETLLKNQNAAAAPQKTQQQQSPLQQSMAKTMAQTYTGKKMAQLLAEKIKETIQQSDENKAQQRRATTAYQKPEQKKTSARSSASAVAQYGSSEDYALVEKAAARVDFTDWGSKNTTQQRAALKRSGLTEEEQWTLLNKDGNYLETLYNISEIQANRLSYGLSQQEAEQKSAELLFLAAARANATGNDQPYLGKIPRAQMVNYLDGKKEDILQSIVNLTSDTVGGAGRVWYDEEKENISAHPLPTPNPQPTPNPNITPNPQTTPDPKITPLPQPGPGPEITSDDWGKELRKRLQKAWQTFAKIQPRRAVVAAQNAIRESAEDNPLLKRLQEAVNSVVPQREQNTNVLNTVSTIGPFPIMNVDDLHTILRGQDAWLEYVQQERELARGEDPSVQTWDESMITNQGAFPSVKGSMGPRGSLKDNGCGPMGLHNVNRILGEDSKFADVAYEVTADSSNRTILGGVLGMNPLTVRDYYEKKGYRVTPYIGTEFVEKGHDAYLAMYVYENYDKTLGGHYVAAEYDGENDEYITYNDVYGEIPIPMENFSKLGMMTIDENGTPVPKKNAIDSKKFVYVWGIDKRGGEG